jgi:hypothetical protein
MKFSPYILLLSTLLVGCENQGDINNVSAINEEGSTDQQKDQSQLVPIFYADIDTKKQHDFELINVENDQYHLAIDKYCLNDSSLRQKIYMDGELGGKLKPVIQVYHNYEVMLHLGKLKSDPYTIFKKRISKEIFKDSLSAEFYNQARVFNVSYHSARSNRIYFDVILSVPDSDWQEEFMCAIFFRTNKTSQLDYWKK